MDLLFWGSIAVLLYIYVGYPLLLWALARLRGPRPVRRGAGLPTVSLVVSAYNEAAVIRKKIENALEIDYPADSFEVVVVSDASSDDTDAVVAEFAPTVRLVRQARRLGKTAGLNSVVPTLTSEIVVFTDANALFAPSAIRMLVRNFSDTDVGCVTGRSCYIDAAKTEAGASEKAYWSYEGQLKRLETQVGSMVGGDGAIYAIRRRLWQPLPSTAINDFLNPLQIVAAGWRAVYEPAALCDEAPAGSVTREFRRRVRIVGRSWRAVFQAPAVLNVNRVGFFAVSVVSHKILRWLAGLFVISAGVAGVGLLSSWAWMGLEHTWWLAGAGLLAVAALLWSRIPSLAIYFLAIQAASLVGVVLGSIGRVSGTWSPQREGGAP